MKNPVEDVPFIHAQKKQGLPKWALLQRQIFATLDVAAIEFADRYTRSDGTLIWREEWPGMDGSDDPYEGFMNMPLYYALGGSKAVYERSRTIWDGITWQWTEYGQIHREFDAYYDWMHHGESNLFFYFFGLADPAVAKDRQRTKRFAGFYNGEDAEAANYDVEKRLIQSPITGSRGPRWVQTGEDWSTHREILDNYLPPFEDLPGIDRYAAKTPWSDDATYAAILERINARQSRGDVPLSLTATSLMTHAFLYGGEEKYREWVLNYLAAWEERTARNGGIIPDNIGLSGEIGEYNDGKWWGGYYGWRWPHGSFSIQEPLCVACCNAAALTGDMSQLDLARGQIDMLWSLGKDDNGHWVVPNRHYDEGWRDYRRVHPMYAVYLWNLSMDEADAERAERGWSAEYFDNVNPAYNGYGVTNGGHMGFNGNTAQWFGFMRGKDADYPEKLLEANLATIASQIENFRKPENDPLTMDHYRESMTIHMWQQLTPMIIEGLAQLTLGGPMHVYHGGLQHARLRYFDADTQQPGLPPGVAALVDKLGADSAEVTLCNTDLLAAREVIVQAGVFGEHAFTSVKAVEEDGDVVELSGRWVRVLLEPGATTRLRFGMVRFARAPSYDTPWVKSAGAIAPLRGRRLDEVSG
ncbi:hypothetical protein PSQ90_13320 [Devosia rhodophyticola]|uniref:Linalool dehydratase/isomerase domain-containing protein n=1 Tax=Devosia rhodophyticola TaxID=3026423 RepID=A0ABY7YVC5_9HYPH|nr:hypothetical protein [Devosia rhodophyticola]WDR05261.1 hypothetical protein PSQ90_13320 [Devosia rhodophyticola]